MEDVHKIFNDDIKEKKAAARGVHGRASRTGRISKVKLPADFLGREYTRSSKAVSFSVEDVLFILQETPTLKELLLQRLDAEYEHYKLAIDRTIDAVARIQEKALQSMMERIDLVEEEFSKLSAEISSLARAVQDSGRVVSRERRGRGPVAGGEGQGFQDGLPAAGTTGISGQLPDDAAGQERFPRQGPRPGGGEALAGSLVTITSVKVGNRRGGGRRPKSPEELKIKVFQKIDEISTASQDISFKTINSLFPGIQYYIYKLKVWENFEAMMSEYRGRRPEGCEPAPAGLTSVEN